MTRRFATDNWRLLVSAICTVALYSLYEPASPGNPGRFTPPFHKVPLTIVLFSLCAISIVSAVAVVANGWMWQRMVAFILAIFPGLFLYATVLWLVKVLFFM